MYSKLSSNLIHSTVWREANHVRILWITMLAMCDRNGVVTASLPGLADAAKITLDECKEGLTVLEATDPYSSTKDYDGARISEMEGGWLLLNYCKYRDKKDDDDARFKARERKREQRRREKCHEMSRPVTDVPQCSTLAPAQLSSAPAQLPQTPSGVVVASPENEKAKAQAKAESEARIFAQGWITAECPTFLRSGIPPFTRLILRLGKPEALRMVAEARASPGVGNPFAWLEAKLDKQGGFNAAIPPKAEPFRREDN